MSKKNYIQAVELTSIDSGTFTGAYQSINDDGLPHDCSIIRIINNCNKDITISYDGSTNHDFLQDGEVLQISLQANASPSGFVSALKKGQVVYVKGAAGTGYIYLAGYYN